MLQNEKAFLDMLAISEIGPELLAKSNNGYNVLVGGGLFKSYADHPRIKVFLPALKIYSTAAGRYQLLAKYYDAYKKLLNLKDFSPDSQDAIALQQIKECRALDDIAAGRFASAVARCAHIWASLPGAGYNQHENQLSYLQNVYVKAGGTLA